MTNIREFIKQLGDKAPAFFDTKDTTVARWLKTGSIPMKAVEKVLIAVEASNALNQKTPEEVENSHKLIAIVENNKPPQPEPEVDPLTHLPRNLDRRLPQIEALPGHQPQVIEMSPTEQNWGVNLTRPGRIQAPMPPMKIRKVDGQDVAYVEQPKPVTDLPPEIGGGEAGWSNRGAPIPQPKRENERPIAPAPAKVVSEEKV